jgi:triosephosphate isomerase (TIM)
MSPNRRFFVGGNFKLNPATLDAKSSLIGGLNKADLDLETGEWLMCLSIFIRFDFHKIEVVIAPPAIYLIPVKESVRNEIQVAAQNCYFKESGAYTGEIRCLLAFHLTTIISVLKRKKYIAAQNNSSMLGSHTLS